LLENLDFSKSSYYYQESAMKKGNKYASLSERINELYKENKKDTGIEKFVHC